MFSAENVLFEKNGILTFFFIILALGTIAPSNAVLKAKFRTTTQSAPWTAETNVSIVNIASTANSVLVDTAVKYQTIDGFGGCFNEKGWKMLQFLSANGRDSIIRSLFDTVTGCKFNICRMPIGENDYSNSWYTLDTFTNDLAMTHFTIARDTGYLLHYIKAAMKYKPDLKMWGSPWTPPKWMKSPASDSGGLIKWETQILNAYALYLEKAVLAYQAAGINFYALSFQNESTQYPAFPGCVWNQAQHRDFIKLYLGPKFSTDKINCELWTPTMNCSDYTYFQSMLNDSVCSKFITTICYQYGGRGILPQVNTDYANLHKKNYLTETDAGNGQNTWDFGQSPTFTDMKYYFDNNSNAYMNWNMVLDTPGHSTAGWHQNSMITLDSNTKQVTYQSQYYACKHFSFYVKPNAKKVKGTGTFANQVTFQNPDGAIVVVLSNSNTSSTALGITFGTKMINVTVPAKGFATAVIYDSAATGTGQSLTYAKDRRALPQIKMTQSGRGVILSAGGSPYDVQLVGIDGSIKATMSSDKAGSMKSAMLPSGVYIVKGLVDGRKYCSKFMVKN
jgi:glucosylceramidase